MPHHKLTGSTQIYGVSLGVYSDEEIRTFSTVKVTVPATTDAVTGGCIPQGMYDLRMGPADLFSEKCETCRQGYGNCPGHFGHIELSLPLYNPLLIRFTLLLLNLWG